MGNDHPGIIQQISRVLSAQGVNVNELTTECSSAPMAGVPLFKAVATLGVPADLDVDEISGELEKIADDLIVDIRRQEFEG